MPTTDAVSATPLVSADGDADPVTVRFVNESSVVVSVAWVDAAGRVRAGVPVAPARGRWRVVDGSVSNAHEEGTFSGHAFALVAGRAASATTNAALAAAPAGVVVGWFAADTSCSFVAMCVRAFLTIRGNCISC